MNQTIKMAGVTVLGAGVGFVVGFKVAEKKLLARFEERLEEETKDMREFYETVRQPYASPQDAVADLIPPPENKDPRTNGNKIQYNKIVPKAPVADEVFTATTPPVVQNVFDDTQPRLITQDEFMANDTQPRLITQDEFMANDTSPEHQQTTLTYYEGSDQLCGEADDPIENESLVVGTEYKTKFGWKSSDANTVHVRNGGLHMDFEIVRSDGSYEQEVLGQTPDESIPPHKRAGR